MKTRTKTPQAIYQLEKKRSEKERRAAHNDLLKDAKKAFDLSVLKQVSLAPLMLSKRAMYRISSQVIFMPVVIQCLQLGLHSRSIASLLLLEFLSLLVL